MGVFTVTGNPTAVGTGGNVELLQGLATSSGLFRVVRVKLGQITTESLTGIDWQINRYTGAFTAGSGGTAITPVGIMSSQGAARSTWLQLNTTAISGGTKTTACNFTMQVTVGDDEVPLPGGAIQFGNSEALQILLVTALPASTNLTYTLWIEE